MRSKIPPTSLPELTRPELVIMKLLWGAQQLSAREVHDRVGDRQSWAYSTTRTILERMVRKDLIAKQPLHGLYVYRPRISRARGLAALVRTLAEQVLETDYAPVVSLFAQNEALSEEELRELERLLEDDAAADDR